MRGIIIFFSLLEGTPRYGCPILQSRVGKSGFQVFCRTQLFQFLRQIYPVFRQIFIKFTKIYQHLPQFTKVYQLVPNVYQIVQNLPNLLFTEFSCDFEQLLFTRFLHQICIPKKPGLTKKNTFFKSATEGFGL